MLTTISALVIFLFPLAWSPGPGNLFFAANGARYGVRSTVRASAGYHSATFLLTLAAGFGLTIALEHSPAILVVLKYAGALWVLWLAVQMMRAGVLKDHTVARGAGFGDGAALMILNPKAWIIIALLFAAFPPSTGPGKLTEVLLITTVFTLNNLLAFTLWTLAGDRLARQFRNPAQAQKLNRVFGLCLAAVALWLLIG